MFGGKYYCLIRRCIFIKEKLYNKLALLISIANLTFHILEILVKGSIKSSSLIISYVVLTFAMIVYMFFLKNKYTLSDVFIVVLGWVGCFTLEYIIMVFFNFLNEKSSIIILTVICLNLLFYVVNTVWEYLWTKYTEIIRYLITGVFTSAISFATYLAFSRYLNVDNFLSQIISWIFAVAFAFLTNKYWVFNVAKNPNDSLEETKKRSMKNIFKEITSFVLGRLVLSIFFEWILFYVLYNVFNINDIIVKTITTVIIVVANYFLSKFIVF